MDLLYFKIMYDADFCFGGLQNYIFKNKNVSFQPSYFSLLSEDIVLQIFSFLNAKDLCHIASVNQQWNRLSNDKILWRKKLNRDAYCWKKINSINNPLEYLSKENNFNLKDGYLNSYPRIKTQSTTYINSILNAVPTVIRNYIPRSRCQKFCLIGPGIDVGEVGIVKKIMEGGREDLYSFVSLSRGNSTGFGGGFVINTIRSGNCCLVPLFTSTKDMRDHATVEKRLVDNCLYGRDATTDRIKINNSAEKFISSVDGVIYVVGDGFRRSQFQYFTEELQLLAGCMPSNAPILILIVTPSASSCSLLRESSCLNFIENVDASKFKQPWQVNKCSFDIMDEFIESLDWINGSSRCK